MALLNGLNDEGITLCMVTHDDRYRRLAKRTLHIFDGRIADPVSVGDDGVTLTGASVGQGTCCSQP